MVDEKQPKNEDAPPKKIEHATEQIRISGIGVADLLNQNFLKKLADQKITPSPFLIAMDLNGESLVTISHHDEEEVKNKVLHIESRNTTKDKPTHLTAVVNALKEL